MSKLILVFCGFLAAVSYSDIVKIAEAKPFLYFPFRFDYNTKNTDEGKVSKFVYDDPFTGIRYKGVFTPYNWTLPQIDLPKSFTFSKPGNVKINVNLNVVKDGGNNGKTKDSTAEKSDLKEEKEEKKEKKEKKEDNDDKSAETTETPN